MRIKNSNIRPSFEILVNNEGMIDKIIIYDRNFSNSLIDEIDNYSWVQHTEENEELSCVDCKHFLKPYYIHLCSPSKKYVCHDCVVNTYDGFYSEVVIPTENRNDPKPWSLIKIF
jgi:hypothetical protein